MTGKVAVVTGGSRIGRAIVQALAEAGADVVIASRKLDACEAAAEQVRASTGRRRGIACHVGRWADCEHLVAETLDRSAGSTCWSTTPGCPRCTRASTR